MSVCIIEKVRQTLDDARSRGAVGRIAVPTLSLEPYGLAADGLGRDDVVGDAVAYYCHF